MELRRVFCFTNWMGEKIKNPLSVGLFTKGPPKMKAAVSGFIMMLNVQAAP
jgi:hypothetical protein